MDNPKRLRDFKIIGKFELFIILLGLRCAV